MLVLATLHYSLKRGGKCSLHKHKTRWPKYSPPVVDYREIFEI
jgi:hypothetical protein